MCVCVGVWKLQSQTTEGAIEEDIGLVLTVSDCSHTLYLLLLLFSQDKAKHYAISANLEKPFNFEGTESFVVQ